MKREIKFRALKKDTKEWIIGDLTHLYYCYDKISNINESCSIEKETVGQYTGLKDRNNKEIYEGDIIRYPVGISSLNNFVTHVVVYYIDGFKFEVIGKKYHRKYGNQQIKCTPRKPNYSEWDKCEIIGNIHENKELLN